MDMKAEMGTSRKAMIRSGISFDKLPNEQKQKDTSTNGRQKNNFAGTAKERNKKDKVAQRSLVAVEEKDSVSDCNEDTQPEFGRVAIVNKYLSPRNMNAHPRMAGMKRHNSESHEYYTYNMGVHSCSVTSSWLYYGSHTGCACVLQYYHL